MTRLLALVVVSLAVIASLMVASFPARSYVTQREQLADAQVQVDALDAEIARLQQRAADLEKVDEIKRIARARYDRVEIGEEAYRITFADSSLAGATD